MDDQNSISTDSPSHDTKSKWLKVLQFFAAYLVAAWSFIQFVDWFLNRYTLSPYWVEVFIWVFVGIIPSLLIYLFHRERINKKVLRLREKIIFPLNIIIIAVGLFLGFGTADLGATTKEIEYTGDDGTITRRKIVKDEFRIEIPIFNFKQTSDDSSTKWLENGIRDLLFWDIHQDKNVKPHAFDADNTTLKVQITKIFYDHYVDGTYQKKEGQYTVNTHLRKSSNGKAIASKTFTGEELSKLLDSMSIYIREAAGVSADRRADYIDLEIQEFTSDSLRAIEQFIEGNYEKAFTIDSTFALAYLNKAQINIAFSEGTIEERYNIDKAFKHRFKLPADRQLQVLIYKHMAYEDWEKAEELVKLQLEIEPNNQVYVDLLYLIFSETQQVDAFIEYAKDRFNKEENEDNAIRWGWALLFDGDYQSYIDYINKLISISPENDIVYLYGLAPTLLKGSLIDAHNILDKGRLLTPQGEKIYKVYDSILNYLEKTEESNTDLASFEGEFRLIRNEMKLTIWLHNDKLLMQASNQQISPLIPSGENQLTSILHPVYSLSKMDYLKDKDEKVFGLQIEQFNTETSWTYFALKLDGSIKRAQELLAKGDLANAEIAYKEAIDNNPNHFYLKDALVHVQYVQATDPAALQQQYQDVVGTYVERKVKVENGKLIYRRRDKARIELLPISKTRYANLSNPFFHIEFDYENEKVIGSYAWEYKFEKKEWIKYDAENQYFAKD